MPPAPPSAGNSSWKWKFCWSCSRTIPAMSAFQAHGNPRNLTNYFNFIRVCIRFDITIRSRMRLYYKPAIAHGTPSADVAFAVLQKVNRTVEFTGPSRRRDLPLGIVNHHQRTRPDQREHRPVFRTNVSIAIGPQIDVAEHRQWNRPPLLNQPAQKSGAAQVQPRIERDRQLYFAFFRTKPDQMCARMLDDISIARNAIGRNSIPGKHLWQVQTVNRTQRIHPVDRRNRAFVFNIREPAQRHDELV